MAALAEVRSMRSIQGEREARRVAAVFMEQSEVDRYASSLPERAHPCRERGRHDYPTLRETGENFSGISDDGYLLRRVKCRRCELVDSVQKWEMRGTGPNRRLRRHSSRPSYTRDAWGNTYLAPAGKGRITPKLFEESVVSEMLADVTYAQLVQRIESRAS